MGKNARINSVRNHGLNDVAFKEVFYNIIKQVRDKPINKLKPMKAWMGIIVRLV